MKTTRIILSMFIMSLLALVACEDPDDDTDNPVESGGTISKIEATRLRA